MFVALLATSLSVGDQASPRKICVGKTAGINCKYLPDGYSIGTMEDSVSYDVLFDGFDGTAIKIDQAKFLLIVEAGSLTGAVQKMEVKIDTAISQAIDYARYSAIELSITYEAKITNKKLEETTNLATYTDITLLKGASIKVLTEGCSLTFTKLTIDSADMIAPNKAFVGANSLTLNDPDLQSITAEATSISIVGTSSASFLNTEKFTNFIVETESLVVELKGTVTQDSKELELKVLEGDKYGTLVLCSNFVNAKKSDQYIWKITKNTNANLVVNGVKQGDSYYPAGTEIISYPPPVSNLYCVGNTGECPGGKNLKEGEVLYVFEAAQPEKANLKIFGFSEQSATRLELMYKYMLKKSFEVFSGEENKRQRIELYSDIFEDGSGKSQSFKNLDIQFRLLSGPVNNQFNLSFGSLKFESCDFGSGGEAKLLAGTEYYVLATNFVTDVFSISTLKQTPNVDVIASDEYTVKDATISRAVFEKDGVKLSYGKEETPAPSKLLALSTAKIPSYALPEKNPLVLNIPASGFVLEANTEGEIPKFRLDVSESKEKVEFSFEGKGWKGYDLILDNGNTEVKATYGSDASAPTITRTGDGFSTLNDVEIAKVVAGTETPKGGLSGGAIAGIVIGCVVVVAAIVVGVFFIVKKNKAQVTS